MCTNKSSFSWRRQGVLVASIIWASVLPGPSLAENGASPLTLRLAIERALAASPAIGRLELALSAQRSLREQLAQSTPWTIDVALENVAGSGPFTGLDGSETTLGVSKVLELGDKPGRRAAIADAGMSLINAEQHAIRVDIATRVASAFLTALAEQRRFEVGEEFVVLATTTRDTVNQRVAVGRSAEAELATAEIRLSRARNASRRAASVLQGRRRQLAVLMATPDSSFGPLAGDLFELVELADVEALQARLDANPELSRLARQQQLRTAERQLAQAERQPNLTIGAGVRRLAQTDDTALVMSFSLPIGQRRRAVPAIDAASAREQAAPLAGAARRLELAAELNAIVADLSAAADEFQALREEIIPLAERAVNLYRTGFERGRYSLFELNAAQRTLLDARGDEIDAAELYHRRAISIRQMLGEIPGEGVQP